MVVPRFLGAGDETAQVWQAGYFNDRDREFHRTFDRHVDGVLDASRHDEEPPIHARARDAEHSNSPMRPSNLSKRKHAWRSASYKAGAAPNAEN